MHRSRRSIGARRGRTNGGRRIALARWRASWGAARVEVGGAVGAGGRSLAAQVAAASSGAAEMAPLMWVRGHDWASLRRPAADFRRTGPIHLAAAVGTAVVGIYGPTDPRRNGPWSPEDICVSRFARCACHHQRRCRIEQVYRGAPAPPPGARWCLEDVTLNDVLDAVARRLSRITPDRVVRYPISDG